MTRRWPFTIRLRRPNLSTSRRNLRERVEVSALIHSLEKQEQLVLNYKKRIDNFVLQVIISFAKLTQKMVEHPIVTRDDNGGHYKFRDEEPEKYVGSPSLAFHNFKNERMRIEARRFVCEITL